MWFPILITLATGYLLGNINGAVCVSSLMNDDVRSHGSGNAGLTNFFRNFGSKGTIVVLLTDMLKTMLSCAVGHLLLQPYGLALEGTMLGGFAVSLGHDFPALLGFRGGKGIVCGLSVAICADWRIAILTAIAFFTSYGFTHYVSLGSIMATLTFGVGFLIVYWGNPTIMVLSIVMPLLALYMHRSNIKKLLSGTESKVYLSKKGKKQ